MNLVIDTAHTHCGVGLFEGQNLIALQDQAIMHGHAAILPSLVEEVVQDFNAIANIIVGVGPGSFTGIRVGIAYAKGLAKGLNIPLFGVNAFQAYGEILPAAGLILVDAKRKDLYGQYKDEDGQLSQAFNLTPEEIGKKFDLKNVVTVGNGISQVEQELGIELQTIKTHQSMVALLNAAFLNGLADPQAAPYYLRSADVTTSRH